LPKYSETENAAKADASNEVIIAHYFLGKTQ